MFHIPHLLTTFQQWTSSQHIYWCQSHERHFFGSSHTQTECQLIHIYIPHSVVFANLKLNTRKRGLRVSSLALNPLCLVEICPSNRSLIPSSRSIRRLLNSRKNCLREKKTSHHECHCLALFFSQILSKVSAQNPFCIFFSVCVIQHRSPRARESYIYIFSAAARLFFQANKQFLKAAYAKNSRQRLS